ncbi:helix-turn-helix domain-containing protein [Rhizobium leguminosarum]
MKIDDDALIEQLLAEQRRMSERLDRIEGKLDQVLDLREGFENAMDAEPAGPELEAADDDFTEQNLIDVGSAAQRAGVSKPTIRRWVNDGGIGFKRRGRLRVSVPRLRRHIGDNSL